MALVPMTDAIADTVASSSANNAIIDNVLDLDARLGPVVSGATAHARLTALEAITSDTGTAPGGIGNQRLADRFGTGVGTTTNVTTGTATAQLTDIRTRLGVLENADACYAYQATAQAISTNTVVTLDAELIDTNTMHVNTVGSNTRITIKKAGVYMVSGMLGLTGGGAGGRRIAMIWKNGVQIPGMINLMPPTTNAAWNLAVSVPAAPISLAVNDYLELVGYQDNGSPMNSVVTAGYNSFLSAVYLRP
jgi:hypothetical protein